MAVSKCKLMKAAGLSVSFMALMAGVTHAQDAAPGAEVIPEVIVTVQKREQTLLSVPAAVTAFNSSFMNDVGITDFQELAQFVPGFEVQDQSPNNPGFIMRGITSDSGTATGEARVSVFQDGLSISRSRGAYIELFDLNRVEIAKGPQSTLFGRGALIGAINVIQNKADPTDFDAAAQVGFGNYDYRLTELMMNLPVTETLAVRLATRFKSRDGYTENLLGGEDFNSLDTRAARAVISYAPTDRLNFDLIVNYQEDTPAGTGFKSGTFTPTNPQTGAVIGDLSPYSGAALSAAGGFKGGRDLGLERYVWGTTVLGRYEISDTLSLSSLSAYRRFTASEVFDADGMSLPLTVFGEDAYGKVWTQELRLNYDGNDKLSWFAGVSYFDEEARTAVPLQIDERVASVFLTNQLPRPTVPSYPFIQAALQSTPSLAALYPLLDPAHRETSTTFGETRSFDVFGDITYRLTPKLEISGGVRYTKDDKTSGYSASVVGNSGLASISFAQSTVTSYVTQYVQATGMMPSSAQQTAVFNQALTGALGLPLGIFKQPTTGNGNRIDRDFEDDGFTYRLVGRYLFSDTLNAYASVSRGRQPKTLSGDSGTTPLSAAVFTEANSETVDSLEAGVKARLFGGRMSWDSAVYYYQYDNFQTSVATNTGNIITVSAGEAKAYGFETQAYYRAAAGVDLFATYAYNHARFGNGLYDGNRFRLSPDHTVSLGARLKKEFGLGTLSFTPSYVWQSEVYFDDNNDLPQFQPAVAGLRPVADTKQDEKQDAYGLLNLRLGFKPARGPWEIELFGTNVTDEDYIKDAGNVGDTLGIATFIQGEPSMYGVNLKLKY
ncbi:TonB-dependent receptor [Asticcacaulis sp. ZE23SCel15]|uniref:TonB-dependent receptor n=1 Tax=Asticcacaulis sp. ZE23SCel15 TaxID=3059027 RepID=UPI00265ECE81|nr:TonB-dependent receptor [Asticcacaulis sp. ZE23SCel15]WKL58067.1 TonB-dependent receptor [Asticcacaulis sp. ZE23SCel15]